jgi:hypothetical protein
VSNSATSPGPIVMSLSAGSRRSSREPHRATRNPRGCEVWARQVQAGSPPSAQVVASAGAGSVAAIAINADLVQDDVDQTVGELRETALAAGMKTARVTRRALSQPSAPSEKPAHDCQTAFGAFSFLRSVRRPHRLWAQVASSLGLVASTSRSSTSPIVRSRPTFSPRGSSVWME